MSPTTFSHSVHNAAAAYIAAALGLRGPTLTVTQFAFPFHEALRLGGAWLAEGRCDAVLVGAADEMGGVLARIAARELRAAADGKIRPFAFAPSPATVPGEGAAFLLLSAAPSGAGFGRIEDVTVGAGPRERPRPDAQLLDADGMAEDETGYAAAVRPDAPAAGYAPLWGGMPAGSAFSCAAAAVMLRAQRLFATPVADEAPGVAVCRETAPARIERVVCAKRDCQSRTGMITLARRLPG